MKSEILQPIVALAAWTMIMWLWMYATRLPAMGKVQGLDVGKMVGGTGKSLDDVLPGKVQWIAHNYNVSEGWRPPVRRLERWALRYGAAISTA